VRDAGIAAVDRAWTYHADGRAELVVAGLGAPGHRTSLADLVDGLTSAMRLVQRAGKIAVLSRAEGTLGPSLTRLSELSDPLAGPNALRGLEEAPDYELARRLLNVLAWADVYLLSSLSEADVEGLSMIPLGRPEEARRLAATIASCAFLNCAERTRVQVADED
jgi:hypothetical protein